jgi:hypothetical protein
MSTILIVNKSSLKIAFAYAQSQPQMLEALFSTVLFNYLLITQPVDRNVIVEPWKWSIPEGRFERTPCLDIDAAKETVVRANLLMQLAKATNRHRRLVQKQGLFDQSTVYGIKVTEAKTLLDKGKGYTDFPFLADSAEILGCTLEQAANLVLMRHIQETQVLRDTEKQRLLFQRRILETPRAGIDQVQKELTEYERRG